MPTRMSKKRRQYNDPANLRKDFAEQEFEQRHGKRENEQLSEFDPYVE